MASPDLHPTSLCIRKLQHRLVGRELSQQVLGKRGGCSHGKSQSQAHFKSWGTDRPQEPCARLPLPTNPVTLPSISQQSRTPTTSDCLCIKALITVPYARPLSSNHRSCSSGEPRAAPNCPSLCGQHKIPHGSPSSHFPTGTFCPNTLLTGEREQTATGLMKSQMKA